MIRKKRGNKFIKVNYAKYIPKLNTLIMVEDVLKDMQRTNNIAELKRRLPKQVNHYTLLNILEYLEESKKIAVSMKGIKWIHSPLRIGHRETGDNSTHRTSDLNVKKGMQRDYIN